MLDFLPRGLIVASDTSPVELSVEAGIGTLSLCRPDRLNALSAGMHTAMRAALERVEQKGDLRALILTGEGRGFCVGADLFERAERLARDGALDLRRFLAEDINPLIQRLDRLPIPIISAINGVAAGAGIALALSADLVLAGRAARFQLSFAQLGLDVDAGLSWLLPKRVGVSRALGLALTGELLSADLAHEWGLVWRVVDDERLLVEARALAEQLSKLSPAALAAIKSQFREPPTSLREALHREAQIQGRLGATSAYITAIEAFSQKRGRVAPSRLRRSRPRSMSRVRLAQSDQS